MRLFVARLRERLVRFFPPYLTMVDLGFLITALTPERLDRLDLRLLFLDDFDFFHKFVTPSIVFETIGPVALAANGIKEVMMDITWKEKIYIFAWIKIRM